MNSTKRQLWYIRREGVVEGPYVAGLIQRRILLGRIGMDDELSEDQSVWQAVRDLSELHPDTMDVDVDDDDPYGQERLAAAMRWADERSGDKRRCRSVDENYAQAENRDGLGRRRAESYELETYRSQVSGRRSGEVARERSAAKKWIFAIVSMVVLMVIFSVYLYVPPEANDWTRCQMTAGPEVNWSYCQAEGAQLKQANLQGANLSSINLRGADLQRAILLDAELSYANLALTNLRQVNMQRAQLKGAVLSGSHLNGADLRGADLSYANLSGADLTNSMLDGVRLDHAVWFDGQLCLEGSVGGCRVAR